MLDTVGDRHIAAASLVERTVVNEIVPGESILAAELVERG